MSRRERRRAERSAGAFLSPYGTIPAPMRTLSDDYRDLPTEPDEEPEPEPEPPSLIRRLVDRLTRRPSRVR